MTLVATIDRWAARPIGILAEPGRFHAVMAVYYAIVGVVSSVLFTGASIDTTEQMMFAQDWALRYDDANPPLFTWLVKLAELILGPGIAAVTLVKFACLWAMHAFLFALGRTLRLAPALTVLVGLSPLTLYYLAWDSTYTYSHSLLMTTACCAGAWAAARIIERPNWWRFATLGAVFCVGLLAKYNFGVFALGLLVALVIEPRTRGAWRRLAATLALTAPALVLLVAEASQLATAATGRLAIRPETDPLSSAGMLLPAALESIWQFLLPMLPLYALAFWPAWLRRPERPLPAVVRVITLGLLLTAAMLVVGLLAIQATTVRTPYVFMFVLIPVALLLRLAGFPSLERLTRIAVLVPLLLMAIVPVGLAIKAAVEPESCRRCFLAFDYAALAEAMQANGFAQGTIVGRLDDQGRVGGLRPYFPESRLVSLRYPAFVPPAGESAGQCALLWYDTDGTGGAGEAVVAFAESVLATAVPVPSAPVKLEVPLTGGREPIAIWSHIWTPQQGECR